MSDGFEFHLQDSQDNTAVTETGDGKCSMLRVADEASDSCLEHGSRATVSELHARVSRNAKSEDVASTEEFRVRVRSECDGGRAGNTTTVDRFEDENEEIVGRRNREDAEKFPGSDSNSLLSEFDEYVAGERNGGVRAVVTRDLRYGFEVGDMVWGKVKSHPWWPGHVYNEAFASPSVRRTKREGHVLVAFFGDSSYGWFEPAELIPFDSNFAEKSQQTNSRTFLKAVEEAVDEACRRCCLGLACRCRNPSNFCPTSVEGYFSVDVPDYEPGGFYSDNQIRKARNSFKPNETLAFVKQLALAPHDGDHGSIGFTKNKATVFAYRKAVFEQYDETYAQAFGVQPLRPSHPQNNPLDQPVRQPPRAPLSGPLVIAEALGGGKNTTKSIKVKDNLKKDRYLFKRRDDPTNSFQLEYREETPDAAGQYVFQKRTPAVPVAPHNLEKNADTGFISHDGATSTSDAKGALIRQVQGDCSGLTSPAISSDAKPHLDKGKESFEEMTHNFEQDNISSKSMGRSDLSGELTLRSTVNETSQPSHLESKISVDVKCDGNAKLSGPCKDSKQTEQGLQTIADGGNDMHQVESENNVYSSPVEAKHHEISAVKKIKSLKRPADDLNSKASAIWERKKKRKKDLNLQPTSAHLEKHSTTEKSLHLSGKLTGKSVSLGLDHREHSKDFRAEQVQVDVSDRNFPPMDTIGDTNFEVPQLLGDLQALALDPFHGIEKKIPSVVQQFFLRFRSLIYQKSLFLSPPTENEAPEVRVTKSPSSVRASDNSDDHVRTSPLVKPVKHIVRLDDPTKAGRKRGPSDRQEEIVAKRLRKIKDIKALAAEKAAASQKTSESRREEGKESLSQAPPKLAKPDSTRKVNRSAKAVDPTTLVIKFPPQTSLPSVAELKARFARFGPMDQSGFRIFWKSSTCRVVFLHKADAQAAYKYSVANQSLFGSMGVRCFLRESGDSAPEFPEAAKARGDDDANETPRVKDPAVVHRQIPVSSLQPLPQPMNQLKSCLKKSTGDESGQVTGNGGSSRGNPRVKFMLGGEESSRGEQLMVGNRNNFNNASFAEGDAPPVAMDFNTKNLQKLTSQPPLPILPLAPQFTKSPQHNLRNSEFAMPPRNIPNFINTTASATSTTVDVSQQMISLLTRCNDVVTNLTSLLGYVPYHPL
ncbi:PWWP domain-containing protein 1 [Gastrolobium bilobum]|uniref:PWWP domain-containing protein 1 n=1 Tax=Gastrolobium bilobum TaxID=150636 RepID=UPI002AB1CC07|nr:PWWP domain-containing protein 1 [Gastrolobium bilobum]